jgi:hypothetical protein
MGNEHHRGNLNLWSNQIQLYGLPSAQSSSSQVHLDEEEEELTMR